jgi:hypothetical protein
MIKGNKSRGLGDDIAKIAKFIKADVTVEQLSKIFGYKDCGCSGRQEALNNPELLVNKVFYNNNENKSNNGI